jgi:hypothetical protein
MTMNIQSNSHKNETDLGAQPLSCGILHAEVKVEVDNATSELKSDYKRAVLKKIAAFHQTIPVTPNVMGELRSNERF